MRNFLLPPDKFDKLREKAEALILKNRPLEDHTPGDILGLIHELKIHQAELEIQNEELKRAQQEISDLHQAYERLYEFAPCGYVSLDPLGSITRVNLTGITLLGAPKQSLLQSTMSDYIATGWQDTFRDVCHNAARTGDKQHLELQLKSESALPLWVRADITADVDESGVAIQWRVVLMDISREKEAEKRKQRLEDQLHQSQKMESIGTLSGGVAHDFNNILSIIVGNYELMEDELPAASPLKGYLEEIRSAAMRARELVRQLLTFARKGDKRQAPLDIAAVVRECLTLIRSTLPANIHIQQHLPEGIDPILGNRTQISQLIINLCTNAADAMLPTGGTLTVEMANVTLETVEAGRHDRLQPGAHVKLVVADTGCGMEAATLEHIFEPYFTTKPFGKGTGIGLAVVHGIVEQHNGEIAVESTVKLGTRFTILFPAVASPVVNESAGFLDLPRGQERILLVDDEAAVAKLGQSVLRRLGYRVTAITDPRKALEKVQIDPSAVDLVITDMAMPHMTGDVLAARLLELRPNLPILLCTGYSETIDEKKARGIGIAGFLSKPAGRSDFALAVRQALDRAKAADSPAAA